MSLPEIYKNKIDEEVRNSQSIYYSKEDRGSTNILDSLPVDAFVETKNKVFSVRIIGKTNNYLITSNNDIINLHDCISIKKV